MKKHLLLFGALFIGFLAMGQSLTLSETFLEYADENGGFDYGEISLTNTSSETISVAVRLERRCHAEDGSGVQFCFGQSCYGPIDDDITYDSVNHTINLAPGGTSTDLTAHLWNYAGEGSNWRLYYFDVDNPSDEVYMDIRWGVCADANIVVSVEENEGTTLSVYPNPTVDVLNVVGTAGQTYAIFNIVGEQVMTGSLTSTQTRLDVAELNNGMYFIKTGNQTKQFVVK